MDQNAVETFPSYVHTEINWTISNFTLNALETRRFAKHDSNIFPIMLSSGVETDWTLSLARKQSCISAYLTSHDLVADEIATLNFRVGIEKLDMTVAWVCEGQFGDWYAYNRLGRLFNFKELTTKLNNCVDPNRHKLKIVVRLDVTTRVEPSSTPVTIANHLESLLGNEEFSNFALVANDGRKFLVNRSLLAARSSVLERMMSANMRESNTNKAVFQDMTGSVLEQFLRFIYCGKSDNIEEYAVELLAAADKYHIGDLKPLCEAFLASDVTLENVVETLIVADFYHSADLKEFCMAFTVWNRTRLGESEAWKHISHDLYKELLEKVIKDNENSNAVMVQSNILVDFQF